jgi:tetratricopeptide (TPR) repeat protein
MNIEELIENERWSDARTLVREALKRKPRSHWLLTRLSLTYYEERQYTHALQYAKRAFALAPSCPLVLWDYAGALQMLGRHSEALDLYARIVTRDISELADGDCGEASLSLRAVGNEQASLSAFDQCLDLRGPGCRSIYRLKELGGADLPLRRRNGRLRTKKQGAGRSTKVRKGQHDRRRDADD